MDTGDAVDMDDVRGVSSAEEVDGQRSLRVRKEKGTGSSTSPSFSEEDEADVKTKSIGNGNGNSKRNSRTAKRSGSAGNLAKEKRSSQSRSPPEVAEVNDQHLVIREDERGETLDSMAEVEASTTDPSNGKTKPATSTTTTTSTINPTTTTTTATTRKTSASSARERSARLRDKTTTTTTTGSSSSSTTINAAASGKKTTGGGKGSRKTRNTRAAAKEAAAREAAREMGEGGVEFELEDADRVVDEVVDEISADDDAQIREYKQSMKEAKEEAKELRRVLREQKRRMVDLKIAECELEASMIQNGTHPEFLQQLALLEAKQTKTISQIQARKDRAVDNVNAVFEAAVKEAHDTYLNNRSKVRRDMIEQTVSMRWQMKYEFEHMNKHGAPIAPTFTTSPPIKKRKAELAFGTIPEHRNGGAGLSSAVTKTVKFNGRKVVLVSPMCRGLDENEADDDLAVIRMLAAGGSFEDLEEVEEEMEEMEEM
ncbi:hypothetical protein HK102_008094 [Quaeritorhiza haematococci]|nr:hypothetical protein HK102_008094 [Quaeritorhiza haematococci]